MDNQNASGNSQKLSAEIKKTWGKLTDEEIGFQASKPDKFYEAVKTKYSISKDEAEKTVKKLEAESAGSSPAMAKPANDAAASGSSAKPANDAGAATGPAAAKAVNA
jgi:uncharacterized protein YjbJ (UPF0337 family)